MESVIVEYKYACGCVRVKPMSPEGLAISTDGKYRVEDFTLKCPLHAAVEAGWCTLAGVPFKQTVSAPEGHLEIHPYVMYELLSNLRGPVDIVIRSEEAK